MKFKKVLFLILLVIFATGAMGQTRGPQTLRGFFKLLSQEYFSLESISDDNYTPEQLRQAQKGYLESFLEIEDKRNGFMQGGGDGAQETFKLALFRRSNGTFVAGLSILGDWGERYSFLTYKNGQLIDISSKIIPGYKRSNIYELPRYGTTIRVFERKNFDAEFDYGEKGRKLYDLIWKNNKFAVKRTPVRKKR